VFHQQQGHAPGRGLCPRRGVEPTDDVERGGLADTVGADETANLNFLDRKRQLADGDQAAKGAGKSLTSRIGIEVFCGGDCGVALSVVGVIA